MEHANPLSAYSHLTIAHMHVCTRTVQHTIEGRRDVRGGRLAGDRRAAGNASSGTSFTSLAFSADGSFLLAGE